MSAMDKMYNCPVEAVLGVIGGKYKPIILYHLIDSTLRFSELRQFLPQATAKMMPQQLRELAAQNKVVWHWRVEDKAAARMEAMQTEVYLTSVNALA